MARKPRVSTLAPRVDLPEEVVVEKVTIESVAPKSDARVFRVRCVDPTLRGYSVRGINIPPGGEVTVTVHPQHVQDVLMDRALVATEVE